MPNRLGRTPAARFWERVRVADVADPEACWNWTGTKHPAGYGQFALNRSTAKTHRFAYELMTGPIPEGLEIDHLCRNRACVNPDHLEAVTYQENLLRRPQSPACPAGHEYTAENTARTKQGHRRCRKCNSNWSRRHEL